jgi:mannose-6-phosphate isomerase-like protein (cupin superfamily)
VVEYNSEISGGKLKLPALFVSHDELRFDPSFGDGGRGARKILVTDIYPTSEQEALDSHWTVPGEGRRCPVQLMSDTEVAYFTHQAIQDYHYHERATEIYTVINGVMKIEVCGADYELHAGDMIVVNPNSPHRVKPKGTKFLCMVVTVNCAGIADKFILDETA